MSVGLTQRDDGDDEDENAEDREQDPDNSLCSSPPRGERCDVNHGGKIIRRYRGDAPTVDAGDSPAICAVA